MKLIPMLFVGSFSVSLCAQDAQVTEKAAIAVAKPEESKEAFEAMAAKLLRTRYPKYDEVKPVYELSLKYPKAKNADAVAFHWVRQQRKPEERSKAVAYFKKHYMDSVYMSYYASTLRSGFGASSELQSIMVASNNILVRSQAATSLAKLYQNEAKYRSNGKTGKAVLNKKAAAIYDGIANTQGLSKRAVQRAKSALFRLQHLSVGKVAPDIVGVDQEDKEFKLSDYRGKVVLLDFWGIW